MTEAKRSLTKAREGRGAVCLFVHGSVRCDHLDNKFYENQICLFSSFELHFLIDAKQYFLGLKGSPLRQRLCVCLSVCLAQLFLSFFEDRLASPLACLAFPNFLRRKLGDWESDDGS